MPVSKFRFVSPGVQTAEIDNSQLPRLPEPIGPVIIGQATRGPMLRPVRVQSFADFLDVFGEPLDGGEVGDVWRDGNRLTPTYGIYAAQAYLKNSSPVTFIRLGGYQTEDAAASNPAGWTATHAYGLFVAPTTGSVGNYKVLGTASLAAVLYADDLMGLTGKSLTGSATDDVVDQLATWVRIDNVNCELRVVTPTNSTLSVNFAERSRKYIRNVLNTNPTAYENNSVTDKKYFLGESFGSWVEEKIPSFLTREASSTGSLAGILLKLENFENFEMVAQDASTGWIISQHLGVSSSFAPTASTGEYPELQKLFKIVGLTEGEWNSQNLKVSIEDVKLPANDFVKYGTFTVSVRKADDNDVQKQYLERFSGLNLDPNSENYIAKRIGDKYTEWDYDKSAFTDYGTYDNNSKFVRVEMNPDVDAGRTEPSLLPFGFYGPDVYPTSSAISTSAGLPAYLGASNTINIGGGTQQWTASFALPQIPLFASTDDSPVASLSSMYWGVQTVLDGTKKNLADYKDYVRAQPAGYDAATAKIQFLFSLDDVDATVVGSITASASGSGAIVESSGATWQVGNRKIGNSVTAKANVATLLTKFNKFTVPMFNGFDGVNILKKNPFSNVELESDDGYAYNSVKVAINSLQDSEVVEMNLAAMPGITNSGLNGMLIEKCELRGDALAIVDLEGDYNPEVENPSDRKPSIDAVINEVKDNYGNTSYGCTFFPWVLIKDTINNNKVWVPPSVAALGTFSSSQKKTELWFAPAGFNRGGLTDGAAGLPVLQTAMRLSSKDRDDLYEVNINPIATFPAEGIVIFGQKTLQVTPSALDRINVRRLMIYLKKEISRMASAVLFDPNVQVTWNRFLDMANPFLASVQSRFGLSEYRVILDETTTTPDLVDRNIVYAKILLKPTRAIEFIALDFVITNTGASFAD